MRFLLPVFLLFVACSPALPIVTETDRAWARQSFPETSDDLEDSRGLYARKCSGCHMLVLPANVPQAEWPRVIEKMAPRAKLEDAQRAQILRYVLTTSRPGIAPGP
jgi:mono/diheme cytochrome c family protein